MHEDLPLRVLASGEASYLLSADGAPSGTELGELVFEGIRRECLAFISERLARALPISASGPSAPEPVLRSIAA